MMETSSPPALAANPGRWKPGQPRGPKSLRSRNLNLMLQQ